MIIFKMQLMTKSKLIQMITIGCIITLVMSQICNSGTFCGSCADSNCESCNDATTCSTCKNQYYLSSDGLTCILCPTSCLICATNTYCDKCTPGYQKQYDTSNNQICVFYWWKWFLIVFGVLIGVVLLGLLIWWIRKKLKNQQEQGEHKQVQYQKKNKYEVTENNLKE